MSDDSWQERVAFAEGCSILGVGFVVIAVVAGFVVWLAGISFGWPATLRVVAVIAGLLILGFVAIRRRR